MQRSHKRKHGQALFCFKFVKKRMCNMSDFQRQPSIKLMTNAKRSTVA
jgi:hypothetical protein